MILKESIAILKEWDSSALMALISKLNIDHISSDEDSVGLSSTIIEAWSYKCTDFLRENGFTGDELTTTGGYFPEHGAIYVIFDKDQVSYEDALTYLKEVASRNV